ncbi:MAG: trigger factor [bacterium]
MDTEKWEIEVEEDEDCTVNFSVQIPADEVDSARDRVMDELKQEVEEPGFRKGKVPDKIIKNKYEPQLNQKVLEELVPEACRVVYRENELNPVAEPQLTDVDLEGDLDFSARVEVRPEVDVDSDLYEDVSIEIEDYEVTDEDLEEKIDDYLGGQTTMEPIPITRPVQEGDFVKVDMVGFTLDGEEIPGTREEDAVIEVGGGHYPEDFEEGLIDGNVGEEQNIEATFSEDFIDDNLAGETVMFKVRIKEIQEENRPDLDDPELLEQLGADSEEDFRAQLRQQMEQMADDNRRQEIRNKIYKNLLEGIEFTVPESLMEQEKEHMLENYKQQLQQQDMDFESWLAQQGKTEQEMMEDMEEEAERRIRLTLTLEAIASEEEIEVTEEDFEEHLEGMAGQYNMDAEQLGEQMNEQMKRSMKIQLREDKVLDYLIDLAEIKTIEAENNEEDDEE